MDVLTQIPGFDRDTNTFAVEDRDAFETALEGLGFTLTQHYTSDPDDGAIWTGHGRVIRIEVDEAYPYLDSQLDKAVALYYERIEHRQLDGLGEDLD